MRRSLVCLLAGLFTLSAVALSSTSAGAFTTSLDTSFGGGDGVAFAPMVGKAFGDSGVGMARLPTGQLVLAGDVWDYGAAPGFVRTPNLFGVAELNADGSFNPAFSGDGRAFVDPAPGAGSTAQGVAGVAVDSSGDLLVAGTAYPSTGQVATVARFNASGTVATAFGAGGVLQMDLAAKVPTGYNVTQSSFAAVTTLHDGSVLAAGTASGDGPADCPLFTGETDFHTWTVLAKFVPGGGLDGSFGNGGVVLTQDFSHCAGPGAQKDAGVSLQTQAVTALADGSIVVAGTGGSSAGSGAEFLFTTAKYSSTGSVDASFDQDGHFADGFNELGFSLFTGHIDDNVTPRALATDSAGRILLAGELDRAVGNTTETYFALARLQPSGQLDPAFNSGGRVVTVVGSVAGVKSLAVSPVDGKIVVAGDDGHTSGSTVTRDLALLRYTTAGTLDPSYGSGGVFQTDIPGFTASVFPAILTGADDSLTVAAQVLTGPVTDANRGNAVAVARYAPTSDITAPLPAVVTATPFWTLTGAPTITWTANDNAGGSGVASFDVREHRATTGAPFGAFTTLLSATTATSAVGTLLPGQTGCYSARARDNAGNLADWSPSPDQAPACSSMPLDDRALTASTGWTSGTGTAYYKHTYRQTATLGKTLTKGSVVGKRFSVVATRCPTCGKVQVSVGSTVLGTLNLASATTQTKRVLVLPLQSALRSGTLKIKVVTSGKLIRIDGAGISRM